MENNKLRSRKPDFQDMDLMHPSTVMRPGIGGNEIIVNTGMSVADGVAMQALQAAIAIPGINPEVAAFFAWQATAAFMEYRAGFYDGTMDFSTQDDDDELPD